MGSTSDEATRHELQRIISRMAHDPESSRRAALIGFLTAASRRTPVFDEGGLLIGWHDNLAPQPPYVGDSLADHDRRWLSTLEVEDAQKGRLD